MSNVFIIIFVIITVIFFISCLLPAILAGLASGLEEFFEGNRAGCFMCLIFSGFLTLLSLWMFGVI